MITSTYGFPFPSFLGAFAALSVLTISSICMVNTSPSVYRSIVSINSLFSFRYRAFAMLFAPFTDHLILRCFIRIVTAVQFWFSCTPMFLYAIPSRLTAVVVLPTPHFWFVRAITLQFDIDASSFRINLATLSGWLCKVPQNAKKPTGFDTNRLCKILNIQLLTFAASSSRMSSVSHLSGNSTDIMRKASYSPAVYAWVAYSISCLSRHSSRRLQTFRCSSVKSNWR